MNAKRITIDGETEWQCDLCLEYFDTAVEAGRCCEKIVCQYEPPRLKAVASVWKETPRPYRSSIMDIRRFDGTA